MARYGVYLTTKWQNKGDTPPSGSKARAWGKRAYAGELRRLARAAINEQLADAMAISHARRRRGNRVDRWRQRYSRYVSYRASLPPEHRGSEFARQWAQRQ